MEFIQAANYTRASRTKIDIGLLVVHDGETGEDKDSAEGMGNYFKNQPVGPNGSSAHVGFDVDSAVQYVHDHDIAWGAPFANHNGKQYEHAGKASQMARDWLDTYSSTMLKDQSAPQFGKDSVLYSIPVRFCRAVDLAAGRKGITTHWEVTKAFSGGIGHTDPGPNFPMEWFLNEVKKHASAASPIPDSNVAIPPTLKLNATGWRVKQLQRLLNAPTSHDIHVTGVFDTATQARVRQFQSNHHLNPDGIVGPNTWAALWAARYSG